MHYTHTTYTYVVSGKCTGGIISNNARVTQANENVKCDTATIWLQLSYEDGNLVMKLESSYEVSWLPEGSSFQRDDASLLGPHVLTHHSQGKYTASSFSAVYQKYKLTQPLWDPESAEERQGFCSGGHLA